MVEFPYPGNSKESHAFKAEKRAALRSARKALYKCCDGLIYCPAFQQINTALRLIDEARDLCSVKKWGK